MQPSIERQWLNEAFSWGIRWLSLEFGLWLADGLDFGLLSFDFALHAIWAFYRVALALTRAI